MLEIKIVFFILSTFFQTEEHRIFAEKTVVTISQKDKTVEVVQSQLFALVETEEEIQRASEQWKVLTQTPKSQLKWAEALQAFPEKQVQQKSAEAISPEGVAPISLILTLRYAKEEDLQALGIWFDKAKNQFSINEIPQLRIQSQDGRQEGNYWYFDAAKPVSFTFQPLLNENTVQKKQRKIALEEILVYKKK